MIAVDTSVWVAAFRGERAIRAPLEQLLDAGEVALPAPVRIEILAGSSRADLPRLRRSLAALPVLYPTESTWARIDGFVDHAVARSQRFGFADLLIAALAAENDCAVWSLDADFERLQKLGLVRVSDGGS